MKSFFLTSCILLTFELFGQTDLGKSTFDTITLKEQTIQIIKALNIDTREYVSRDRPLKYVVDSLEVGLNAEFYVDSTLEHYKLISRRVYLNPKLKMSPKLWEIFFSNKDTTEIVRLKAISFVAHELTHYFQTAREDEYIDPQNKDQEETYIKQQSEFEAWAVGAYYFLYFHDRKALNEIMNQVAVDMQTKMKRLINAYRQILYPWKTTIFPGA